MSADDRPGVARLTSGGMSPRAINQWLKVVLLGDARVGKTSLIKALKNSASSMNRSTEYKPTTGAWITYYDVTDSCRLLITDASGRQEFTSLVNLYLRNLHGVVFVFALDEPSSFKGLATWYERFAQAYKGDPSKVAKFVVGTKMDTAQDSAALQAEATSFAEEIGAEMWITSACKSFNTHELFTRIAENAEKMPFPSNEQPVSGQNDIQDGRARHLNSHMLDDVLLGKGALVRYPDPILLDTDGEKISEILLTHQCLTMTGQKRTFKWGTSSKKRADESLMRESSKASHGPRGKLWSCVMANAPPSTWQYETLEGVIKYGTLIRRQPTKAGFKGTNKMLFTSRDKLDRERNHGLFYMLLSTEDGLSEIGLNSVLDKMCRTTSAEQVAVQIDFHLKPAGVSGKVASASLSCSHAAVVVSDDNRVSTWGHGGNGALGLEQHIISNFDPPYPTPVSSINSQIKQVACGRDFTLMLTMEGSVYSCGSGAFGKLGHGDEEDKMLPTLIQALQNMQAIYVAAGGDHAAAIINRGYLYQWGQECADEQLTRFVATPTRVRQIDSITVTSISCGKHYSVLAGHGRVYSGIPYAWGRGSNGRLGLKNCRNVFTPGCIFELYKAGKVVTQVSAGTKHTALLTKDGEVYTCGSNAFGQLGYFTARGYSDIPCKVFLGKNAAGDEIRAEELCCNEDYTMVLTRESDVVVWGKCYYGTKLEDPIPIDPNNRKDVTISDVTTCNIPTGDSFVELVVALTTESSLMVCAEVKLDSDCQVADDTTPLISLRCNNINLTSLNCVDSVLVSMDEQGNVYYADLGSWVHQFLPPPTEGHNIPDNGLVHALISNMKERPEPGNLPPVEFVALSAFRGSVMAIEATLSSFLFCSNIGDVYSWIPVVGGHLTYHKELNSEIIVQIACGAKHFAALSSEGMLFTCGDGSSGQLGTGIFKRTNQFQMVPLTEFETVRTVCCGWASTSVITENGKVYFWGQLDIPRSEKTERKQSTIPSPSAPFDLAPGINQARKSCLTPAEYKVKIRSNADILESHLAIVGTALEIEIIPRDANIDGGSCMEFRAETYNVQVPSQIHSKGTIKRSKTNGDTYVVSIVLHSEGSFNLFITRNGQNVLGSPLRVNAEKGVIIQRCKLSLIGSDIDCLRAVSGVLQKAIKSRDSHIALWGVPNITADLLTQEALQLASMTDGALYIYLWDANRGNLPEENFTFWLRQVSLFAPSSNVILLGVNLSTTYANEIDLEPFQKVNPMLKRSIFAGTTFAAEPGNLLDEVLLVIQEFSSNQRHVWSRFELLAAKVEEKKKDRVEVLDETAFKCLAGECGIQGEPLYRKAAEHLEMTGMALVIPGESLFLILQPYWLARYLAEMAKSSNFGAMDRNFLDMPKRQVVSLLTSKRLALESMDSSTIYIVPYLSVMPEETWCLVDESRYTIYRHLILTVPPYNLHSIFRNIAASVLKEFSRVFLGRYSLAIYNDEYQLRIDFGPCVINKSVAEMRLTVRANSQDMCSRGAEAAVSFLQRCCEKLQSSFEVSIKTSCSVCRQYYVDFPDVQEAEARGDMKLSCGRCHAKNVSVGDSLNGFKETRAAVELNWKPFHGLQETGSPHSKPGIQVTDAALLRPIMRYFGDREERLEANLLREIKGMFGNMTKVFADIKNYDVPRTICLLPEFQRTSVLKANAVKMLLTFGQPKFRLFLLCEGNGDGTGVHFLEYRKHRGYRLEESVADGLIKECVDTLRFTLKLLRPWSSVHNLALGMGLFDEKDVEETVSNLLGVVGLSGTMLCAVSWTKIFKGMDDFLKGFQESASSIRQPKGLGELSGVGVGYQLGGEKYEILRKHLLELGTTDDFGGLRQEPRDGIGAIWVCEKHRMYGKDTTSLRVMP